jgi:hypothetical protein
MVLSIQDLDDYTTLLDLNALKRINAFDGYNYYLNGRMLGIGTSNPLYELDVNGTVRFLSTIMVSDERKKTHIVDMDPSECASIVDAINVRKYAWKKDTTHTNIGFIAQEVEKIVPSVVSVGADTDGTKAIDHFQMTAILFGAVKALNARVADLESQMANE